MAPATEERTKSLEAHAAPEGEDPVRLAYTSSRMAWRHEHMAEVTSTNQVLLARAAAGENEGLILSAESQTQGRGRLGREWYSPPGLSLYLSILLRPRLTPPEVPFLSFVAGLAAYGALRALGCEVWLKWPNDVVGGTDLRKVAGILSELRLDGDRVAAVVVGIGLNVHPPLEGFPAALADRALSADALAGRRLSRSDVLSQLVQWFEAEYLELLEGGRQAILARWRNAALPVGAQLRFQRNGLPAIGTSLGLDEEGALLLLCEGNRIRLTAGDVELIRVASSAE